MNHPQPTQRIVVGIDGSDAAINAAKWAVTEAISRNIPLRLVHAIPERTCGRRRQGDDSLDIEYGETSLRAADAALQAMGEPVKVECDIVHGSPESALINESRRAAMICIGSVGIGRIARKVLGSTADAVAQKRTARWRSFAPTATPHRTRLGFRVDRRRRRRVTRQRRGARARLPGSAAAGGARSWRWGCGAGAWAKSPIASWIIGLAPG